MAVNRSFGRSRKCVRSAPSKNFYPRVSDVGKSIVLPWSSGRTEHFLWNRVTQFERVFLFKTLSVSAWLNMSKQEEAVAEEFRLALARNDREGARAVADCLDLPPVESSTLSFEEVEGERGSARASVGRRGRYVVPKGFESGYFCCYCYG